MGAEMWKKSKRPGKYQLLVLVPFAFCYAFFIVLGDWQRSARYGNAQNMLRLLLWTAVSYGVLLLLGFLSENGGVLTVYLPAGLQKIFSVFSARGSIRRKNWRVWLFFFLLCLLCYLPYYLMYFPTWFNNDAVWQMEQALGLASFSNHHPYFHTLIIKAFLIIGYGLFGSYAGAVALYTFFQMALTAAVFGFFLYLMYHRGTGVLWLVLAVCFYALLPINGMYSICMGKDAWFTAAFLLFLYAVKCCSVRTEIPNGVDGQGVSDRRRWFLFFVTGLSVCLLRSNGIFVFLGTAFFMILSQLFQGKGADGAAGQCGEAGRRQRIFRRRQNLYVSVAAVLVLYLLWQGPVLAALHVEPPDTIESLTMPTQHLLCAYVKGGSFTQEEVEMLEAVVPLAQIDEYYNPYLFDMTKNYIRENGNQQMIAEHKWEYAKLWLRVGLRNPMLYLEAQIRQTAGYYALHIPHDQILYGEYFMVDNPFGIETRRKVFSYDAGLAMSAFLQWFQSFYNRVWSLGMNTWLLLAAFACALYRRREAMVFVPCVMLLGSLFLASPVYNEFRYAYGVFAALPFLFSVCFGRQEADG